MYFYTLLILNRPGSCKIINGFVCQLHLHGGCKKKEERKKRIEKKEEINKNACAEVGGIITGNKRDKRNRSKSNTRRKSGRNNCSHQHNNVNEKSREQTESWLVGKK